MYHVLAISEYDSIKGDKKHCSKKYYKKKNKLNSEFGYAWCNDDSLRNSNVTCVMKTCQIIVWKLLNCDATSKLNTVM